MDQRKLIELKQRAKSAFGINPKKLYKKERYSFPKKYQTKEEDDLKQLNYLKNNIKRFNSNQILSPSIKNTNYFSTNYSRPSTSFTNIKRFKNRPSYSNYNYYMDENIPFTASNNSKNFININNKLINDLNAQINSLNEKKQSKKFNYKQTVNLQKLNDYIIYEYTKNKMEFNKENKKKNSISFRLPLQYRRMGNHGKKEDLIPINNKPKINLEDILIMHNSNLRTSMTKNKVQNYYLKNNIRYKKYKPTPYYGENNKLYSDEIALKYINIL